MAPYTVLRSGIGRIPPPPPVRKWGALRQHPQANIGFNPDFFTFILRRGTPKAGSLS